MLKGGLVDDKLIGGKGDDVLKVVGSGDDVLKGGREMMFFTADQRDDVLRGGTGDDVLKGGLWTTSDYGK